MSLFQHLRLCSAFTIAVAASAWAQPQPLPGTIDYDALFSRADCVVVGTVTNVSSPTETGASAEILPNRVYKVCGGTHSLRVAQTVLGTGAHAELRSGETVLLFLSRRSASQFLLTEPSISIVHGFPTLPVSSATGPDALLGDLLSLLPRATSEQRLALLQVLNGFPRLPPPARSSVAPLLDSLRPEEQLFALAVYFAVDASDALRRLTQIVRNSPERLSSGGLAVFAVAKRVGEVTNSKALPFLHELAKSQSPVSIRYAALDAIRSTAASDSVPTLITLLDDANPDIRLQSVSALSHIVGKSGPDFYDGVPAFEAHPQTFIAAWKRWWREEGRAEYAGRPDASE